MIYEEMAKRTYVLEHNPNCPSPYLVRLPGFLEVWIDKKPANLTTDILGYGQTFEEAAGKAIAIHTEKRQAFHAARQPAKV